jgi:hypothetical protein
MYNRKTEWVYSAYPGFFIEQGVEPETYLAHITTVIDERYIIATIGASARNRIGLRFELRVFACVGENIYDIRRRLIEKIDIGIDTWHYDVSLKHEEICQKYDAFAFEEREK